MKPEHIGLLFVHGIGEQKRFEHLIGSVTEIAELMCQCESKAQVSVVDRTAEWKFPPGHPDPAGTAPMTLTFQSETRHIVYECYEVWWADLGARAGIWDQIRFWLWALGQWGAPIYKELDATHLDKKEDPAFGKPVSVLARLPESVAGDPIREPMARFKLLLAGLAAFFVAFSWTLAKRVLAALVGQAPTPTLIVQYVGDVRTYEERASPGDSAISDPGHPRRVGLRRRMVTEMVALGMRPLDGWFVLAHSLGTVLAYNGLTEIGHALPNYLPQDQWARLDNVFKRDDGCIRRDDLHAMMPSRPDWLQKQDVINRPLLFAKLKGILTYGSPLDKFANLWPRIVATATDRNDHISPFPRNCRWVNLAAPHDPVAGMLIHFEAGKGTLPANAIPKVHNKATPWDPWYVLAHILYFAGAERCDDRPKITQRRHVARWLLGHADSAIPSYPQSWLVRFLSIDLGYFAIILFLWFLTAIFVTAAGGISSSLLGGETTLKSASFSGFFQRFLATLGPVLGIALSIILMFGLWRWYSESRLNAALAQADQQSDQDKSVKRTTYWNKIVSILRQQSKAALLILVVSGVSVLFGLLADFTSRTWLGYPTGWLAATAASAFIIVATTAQTSINHKFTKSLQPAKTGDGTVKASEENPEH